MERKNVNIYLTTAILATILMFSVTIQPIITINSSEYKTSQVSTTIYVDPPTLVEPSSASFTVGISIENVTGLYAWQARLKWDPQLLDFVDVTEGDFLETGNLLTGYILMNQSEGWIFVFGVSPVRAGVNGSGTLAKVTFRGASPGECVLDLYNTKLFNSAGDGVPTPPYLGDADGSLRVDIIDKGLVDVAFGTSEGDPRYKPNADFNKDGCVDLFDLFCVMFNWGKEYPVEGGTASKPVEIAHETHDGYVTILPFYAVTWKWLDFDENPVWLTVNVTVSSSYPIENFSFNRSLGQISFNFTSATSEFCNVTIPKLLMDGAFKVLINDTQVASILTWNKTHTFIYFTYDQGLQNVAIEGEIVTRIRSMDLLYLVDVNADGIVDVIDLATVSKRYNWEEDR